MSLRVSEKIVLLADNPDLGIIGQLNHYLDVSHRRVVAVQHINDLYADAEGMMKGERTGARYLITRSVGRG